MVHELHFLSLHIRENIKSSVLHLSLSTTTFTFRISGQLEGKVGEGNGTSLQYSCLEKSHGRRSLVGCSPWSREELDMTERLHFHFSLLCIGEGNSNPLQCSCLENPRDGVAQSWTWLKWLSSSSEGKVPPYMHILSSLAPFFWIYIYIKITFLGTFLLDIYIYKPKITYSIITRN